jgi:FkbM family methyltransferase
MIIKNKQLKAMLRACLPRTIRRQRILAGPLRGRTIVTSWFDYPAAILGRTERPLLDWFASNVKPGETWLDIGAHYGYTALALCSLVGEAGRVYAFEPMLSTAGYLNQTRILNQYVQMNVVPLALGRQAGLQFHQLPVERGMVDSTRPAGIWMERLTVTSLDWLWPYINEKNDKIDGVKIDVQGMEIEALQGMTDLLKQHRPKLVVEVHAGVDRTEFLAVLRSAGYSRAVPVEPMPGETEPGLFDNRSYEFS